jgi:hypothetical protein
MIEPALFTATPAPEEDVTTTLYRAAIGPVSGSYYLPIFTRFEAADHAGISWNTTASLLTLNWLIFRKLWLAALAYVGLVAAVALLVFGVGHLVLQFSDTLMMGLGLGFGLVAFVLPGLFGNALFHTQCRKAMSKALAGHPNVADARDALLREASSRRRAIWLAAANVAFLLIAVLVYLQIAAFNSVAVLPHGALEAGQVAVGRTVDVSAAAIAASSPAPRPVASAASTPASSAAIATSEPASSALASASAPTAAASAIAPPASEPKPAASVAKAATAAQTPIVQTVASAPLAVASTAASAPKATSTQTPAVTASQPAPTKPVAKASKAQAAPEPKGERATVSPTVEVKSKKEPEKAKKLQTALSPPKPTPTASEATDTVARPYFINVGLFSVPENAERAHAKLLNANLPSVMKELKAKTRQIRVRVGPFASQASADAAAEKIKALQLDAVIIQP